MKRLKELLHNPWVVRVGGGLIVAALLGLAGLAWTNRRAWLAVAGAFLSRPVLLWEAALLSLAAIGVAWLMVRRSGRGHEATSKPLYVVPLGNRLTWEKDTLRASAAYSVKTRESGGIEIARTEVHAGGERCGGLYLSLMEGEEFLEDRWFPQDRQVILNVAFEVPQRLAARPGRNFSGEVILTDTLEREHKLPLRQVGPCPPKPETPKTN